MHIALWSRWRPAGNQSPLAHFEVRFTELSTLPAFSDDPAGVAVRIAGAVLFVSGVGWLPWPASAAHTLRLIKNSIVIRHSAVVLLMDRSPSWKGPKALPLPGRPTRAPPLTIPRPDVPPAQQDDAQGRTPVTVRPPRSNPTARPPLTTFLTSPSFPALQKRGGVATSLVSTTTRRVAIEQPTNGTSSICSKAGRLQWHCFQPAQAQSESRS